MKTFIYSLTALSASLILAGCGSDSENAEPVEMGAFSLAVSDAPVDDASKVVLGFEDVVLIPVNSASGNPTGDPIHMKVNDDGSLQQVDLMQYQGSAAETIISERQVPAGDYAMCVYVKDGKYLNDISTSYVEKINGNVVGLVVPSQGSCHGFKPDGNDQGRLKFSQKGQYVSIHTGHNRYVVEFNLRSGLTDPNGHDYMLMNSNAVSLVNADEAGHIGGEVSTVQYQACEADSAALNAINDVDAVHAVYLYAGIMDRTSMGDIGNADPEKVEPVAVADVNTSQNTGELEYEFGYVGPGSYTIGYTCTAHSDLPETHETLEDGFMIYQHYTPVEVIAGETTQQNIDPIL